MTLKCLRIYGDDFCGYVQNSSGCFKERRLNPELKNRINKHRALCEYPEDIHSLLYVIEMLHLIKIN